MLKRYDPQLRNGASTNPGLTGKDPRAYIFCLMMSHSCLSLDERKTEAKGFRQSIEFSLLEQKNRVEKMKGETGGDECGRN